MPSISPVSIAGRLIGPGQPPYIVAELSANHLGSLERALKLVDIAADCGCDAVKLQTYCADTITIDHDGPGFVLKEGPWQGRKLFDLYEEAHMPWDWHAPLFERARARKLAMFSSPFDETAVEFLETLGAPAYKIASFEIVDTPLIERCAATGKPLVISTGLASEEDVTLAVETARRAGKGGVILLHCTSGYPTPASEANLATMALLSQKFGVPCGLSDHTLGIAVPVAAVALGAAMIEKHYTLRRDEGGPDAEFSLEPDEFKAMVDGVRNAYAALGKPTFQRRPSELANKSVRRSLYVVADIKRGEAFTAANVRSIRPGYGLPPRHLPEVMGRKAATDIARGTPLDWPLIAR
jgi:N-acetylneuraminate synthase